LSKYPKRVLRRPHYERLYPKGEYCRRTRLLFHWCQQCLTVTQKLHEKLQQTALSMSTIISAPPDVMSQISLVSTTKYMNTRPSMFKADSDWIGVDMFSPHCLKLNNINDFYSKPQCCCNHQVLSVSGVPTSITY
jgi:hypothetical protein